MHFASPNINITETLIVPSQNRIPLVVAGCEIGNTRLPIVDSGCSNGAHPIDLALKMFPQKIRKLIKSITFETAVGPVICSKGCTVQFGPWDVPLDVCGSPGSPSLLSVG